MPAFLAVDGQFEHPRARAVAGGDEDAAVAIQRRRRVDVESRDVLVAEEQFAAVGVDADQGLAGHRQEDAQAAALDQQGRRVAGRVAVGGGRFPATGRSSCPGRRRPSRSAGTANHMSAVHQRRFRQCPLDVLRVEPLEDVQPPDFFAPVGAEATDVAQRGFHEQAAVVDSGRRSRAA